MKCLTCRRLTAQQEADLDTWFVRVTWGPKASSLDAESDESETPKVSRGNEMEMKYPNRRYYGLMFPSGIRGRARPHVQHGFGAYRGLLLHGDDFPTVKD